MRAKEQIKRLIMFWAKVLIVLIQAGMFAWLWYAKLKNLAEIQYWHRGNWAVIALYFVMIVVFSKAFGGYKVGYLRNWDVITTQIMAVIVTNGMAYIQLCLIGNWKLKENLEPILVLTVLDIVLVVAWVILMRWIYANLFPPHQMLLIHGDISPDAIMNKLETRQDRFHIKETIHINQGVEAVLDKIDEFEVTLIGDIPAHERNIFLKYCFARGIRCYSIPKISDLMITSSVNVELFDSPLMLFRNNGMTAGQACAKRIMDIVISIIGIILSSPIMLIIILAIKLYDHGPVFYKQERLSKEGAPFQILKFRSMIVDSEKDGARLASKHDDRITPVGRVIRRLHFDELPQLFNVLRGDMAFVGPRPEREEIYAEYEQYIPQFRYRLKMKAGLTGYAQVYGNYQTVPYDKLKLDLTYIEKFSIWLDIKLIFMTVKILFQKEKSEGVDDNLTTAMRNE
jgi:exopolysaccharide biosynthesis polyprenyl glycosylphosphotransferase